MSRTDLNLVSATAVAVAIAGSASAAYQNNMFSTPLDPSSYGNLVASLDGNNSAGSAHPVQSWDWPHDTNFFTNSGYVNSIGATEFDRMQVISEVFEVHTQQTFNDGGDSVTLEPGDRVYSYRLRMVESSGNSLNSMFEFMVTGFGLPGNNNSLATSLLKGRGYHLGDYFGGSTPAAAFVPTALAGDLDDTGGFFGGSVDFQWTGPDTEQLDNSEEITILLFAEPTPIGFGLANFAGDPGQASGVDPNANGAPILIPYVPSPGVLGLAGVALMLRGRNRR